MTINTNSVFLGTSITLGTRSTPEVVTASERFSYLIAQEFGLTEINKGVSANDTADMIARFETDVTAYNPAIVSIEAGTNDLDTGSGIDAAQFETNIRWLIERALEIGARVVLWTFPTNTDSTTQTQKDYLDVLRKMPVYYPIILIDSHAHFAEYRHFNGSLSALLMDDWHPTVAGHAFMAGLAERTEYQKAFLIATEDTGGGGGPSWVAATATQTMNREVGWQNTTLRQRIDAANIVAGALGLSNVRVTFKAGATAWTINNAFIGQNSSGIGFDSAGVRLTFSGNNNVTIPANTELTSDSVAYGIIPGKSQVISIETGATNYRAAGRNTGSAGGWQSYYKSGADASNASPASYSTSSDYADGVVLIEAS